MIGAIYAIGIAVIWGFILCRFQDRGYWFLEELLWMVVVWTIICIVAGCWNSGLLII